MNNDIIKTASDFEVRKPAKSYEEFCEMFFKEETASDKFIEGNVDTFGTDILTEIENIKRQEYQLYLQRYNLGLE